MVGNYVAKNTLEGVEDDKNENWKCRFMGEKKKITRKLYF